MRSKLNFSDLMYTQLEPSCKEQLCISFMMATRQKLFVFDLKDGEKCSIVEQRAFYTTPRNSRRKSQCTKKQKWGKNTNMLRLKRRVIKFTISL